MLLFGNMTWVLNIIHRPYCKQMLAGSIFRLHQQYHCAEGSVQRLANVAHSDS